MAEEIELEPDKYKSLREVLDELGLDLEEIFNRSFMEEYTEFITIDDMFKSAEWLNSRGDVKHQVTVGDADEFTDENTEFPTWHQFMDQALNDYWQSPEENRRRHERHSCDMKVTVEAGMDLIEGTMVDISKSGFRIKSDEDFPDSRTVKVTIPDSESSFGSGMEFRGAVRWKENGDPSGMGVEILSKQKI